MTGGQGTAEPPAGGSAPLRVVIGEDSVLLLAGLVRLLAVLRYLGAAS